MVKSFKPSLKTNVTFEQKENSAS